MHQAWPRTHKSHRGKSLVYPQRRLGVALRKLRGRQHALAVVATTEMKATSILPLTWKTERSWRGIVLLTHLAREGRMTVTIGRRELLAALGAAAAWPVAARPQQPAMHMIGYLDVNAPIRPSSACSESSSPSSMFTSGQFRAPLQLHRGLDRLDALSSRSNGLTERSPEPLIGFDQLRVLIRRGNRRL